MKILPYLLASIFASGIIFGGDQLVQMPGYGTAVAKHSANVRKAKRVARREARKNPSVVVSAKKSMKFKGFDIGSVVGGVVGGIGSGVVTNWIMRPKPRPEVVYVEEQQTQVVERVVVRERVVVKPKYLKAWTAEWYKACAETYNSFNARSGEFTTYGGKQRFCKLRKQ